MSDHSALDDLSADEVIARLGLEYLDGEGVWFRVLWRNETGSAIYGLVTTRDFSALHRLREDELWVHLAGAPLDMLQLHPDGSSERVRLGRGGGESLHAVVPAGSWQGASPLGDWTLVTCALSPAFSGLELATSESDLSTWAPAQDRIRELIRG